MRKEEWWQDMSIKEDKRDKNQEPRDKRQRDKNQVAVINDQFADRTVTTIQRRSPDP